MLINNIDNDAYAVLITFGVISRKHFFPIWHYVPFGISYFRHYFHSTFLPFDIMSQSAFLTFDIISIWHFTIRRFVLPTFLTIWHFVCRHFVQFDVLSFDVFYRQRFLLQHLVGEPYTQGRDLLGRWTASSGTYSGGDQKLLWSPCFSSSSLYSKFSPHGMAEFGKGLGVGFFKYMHPLLFSDFLF